MPRPPVKVLVVDDEPDVRALLSRVLDADGHPTRTAGDGPTALEIHANWHPDVMVIDLDLPGLDGYAVARRLRARDRRVRLIAVTGWSACDAQRRCVDAGFDAFLEKPVPPPMLLATLARPRGPGRPLST